MDYFAQFTSTIQEYLLLIELKKALIKQKTFTGMVLIGQFREKLFLRAHRQRTFFE